MKSNSNYEDSFLPLSDLTKSDMGLQAGDQKWIKLLFDRQDEIIKSFISEAYDKHSEIICSIVREMLVEHRVLVFEALEKIEKSAERINAEIIDIHKRIAKHDLRIEGIEKRLGIK